MLTSRQEFSQSPPWVEPKVSQCRTYCGIKGAGPGNGMQRAMTCPACGKTVSGASPRHGFCPACLLQQAAEITPSISETHPEGSSFGSLPVAFGPYELLKELGRGGMSIVYKARRRGCSELLAVKVLTPGNKPDYNCLRRLRVEASAGATLRHPGIVSVHEVGVHKHRPYLVMEYVAYLRRSSYNSTDAQDLTQGFFAQVLRAGTISRADPQKGRPAWGVAAFCRG